MNVQFFLDKLASCFGGVDTDSNHPKEFDTYIQNCSVFLSPINECDYDNNRAKPKPQHRRAHTVDNIREMRRRQSRALGVEFKSNEWDNVLSENSKETTPAERTHGQASTPPRPDKSSRSTSNTPARHSTHSAPSQVSAGRPARDTESNAPKILQEKFSRSSRHSTPQRSASSKSLRSLQSKDDIFRLKGKQRQLLQEMSSVSTSVTEKFRLCLAPSAPPEDGKVTSYAAPSTGENNYQERCMSSIQQEYARTTDTGDSGPASMYFERTISQLQASQPLYKSSQVPVGLDEQDGLTDMLSIRAKIVNRNMMVSTTSENASLPLCFDAADGLDYVAVGKKPQGHDSRAPLKMKCNSYSPARSETSRDVPEATRTESTMSSVSQSSSRIRQIKVSDI